MGTQLPGGSDSHATIARNNTATFIWRGPSSSTSWLKRHMGGCVKLWEPKKNVSCLAEIIQCASGNDWEINKLHVYLGYQASQEKVDVLLTKKTSYTWFDAALCWQDVRISHFLDHQCHHVWNSAGFGISKDCLPLSQEIPILYSIQYKTQGRIDFVKTQPALSLQLQDNYL